MCNREREREREREKGRERVHVCVKMRHLNASMNMYSYITFTHNLPDSNAMLLSGGVPGYKESDVKLLASTIIKHTIWELYLQAAATTSMRSVAHPSPSLSSGGSASVVVMKPMRDLCRISQQKRGAIKHSENRPEEKSTVLV